MKEKTKSIIKWILNSYIWLGVLLLILDIVSKNLVVANQKAIIDQNGVVLIPNFLRINYVINKNIVFGLDIFKNADANRIIFIVFALLIATGIIIYLTKRWVKINRYYKACLMMIIAGAIGNCIDRIFYNAEYLNYLDPSTGKYITGVVDWIDFYGVWQFNFNIADSAVVVSAFMLIIYMIVTEIIDYRQKKDKTKSEESNQKAMSKTEQDKLKYLDTKDQRNEENHR